jgi:hypothetical protein
MLRDLGKELFHELQKLFNHKFQNEFFEEPMQGILDVSRH